MDTVSGKWALVTGASSGFGVEFATLLAEQKANLVLVARRAEPMERLAEQLRQQHRVNVVVEGIDLSRVGAGTELKSRLDRRAISVDVLVNNAGCGMYGSFVEQPGQKLLGRLQLNMLTVTELTHIFAAEMVKRRSGHILMLMMKPRPVARTGILAMLHRRSSVVAGVLNKAVVFAFRFVPRHMQRMVMQRVMAG